MKKIIHLFICYLTTNPLFAQSIDTKIEFNRITKLPSVEERLKAINELLNKESFALGYVFRAQQHQAAQNHNSALADYETALGIDPVCQQVFEHRGRYYLERNEYDLALTDFSTSLEIKPYAETYNARGYTYWLKEDCLNAQKDFDEALRMKPNLAAAQANRQKTCGTPNPCASNDIILTQPLPNTQQKERCLQVAFQLKCGNITHQEIFVNGAKAKVCNRGIGVGAKNMINNSSHSEISLEQGTNHIKIVAKDEQHQTIEHSFEIFVERARAALLIGNQAYPHDPLSNPYNDVDSMKNFLQKTHFEVSIEKDVKNTKDFELKIRQFIENQQDKSVLLFFYAGHGEQLAGIPHLQGVDERGGNGYSIETLFESLKRVQSAQKNKLFIIIIDACRNEAVRQQKTDLKTFLPRNTMVVFATFSGEKALDICGTNGCFTRAFLDALQMPQLTLNDVCNKARDLLMKQTKKQQSVEESTLLTTGFKF